MRPTSPDRYEEIVEVQKFNPFHDALGRFASADGFKTYSANIYSKAGAKAVARSAAYGHGETKNVHASSVGTVGGDADIASGTLAHFEAIQEPKKPKKKPVKGDHEPSAADKYRPEWMPVVDRRSNETQSNHPAGQHQGAEAVKELTGVSDQEAAAMFSSVHAFSQSSYHGIRSYAHGGPPPSDRKTDAENLEKFIAASPQWDDGDLYRGIHVNADIADQILAQAKSGKPMDQRGPASWSTNRSTADDFAEKSKPGEISIIFKTRGRQNGTSIKHLSAFPGENEVLMSNNARWVATEVREVTPGTWEVLCDAIDVP